MRRATSAIMVNSALLVASGLKVSGIILASVPSLLSLGWYVWGQFQLGTGRALSPSFAPEGLGGGCPTLLREVWGFVRREGIEPPPPCRNLPAALPASCAGLFSFACGGAGHGSWFHSLGDGGPALSCVLSISVSIGIRDLATKVRS